MKLRLAVVTAALCALATPSFAQISGGVKVGMGFNKVSASDADDEGIDFKNRTGFIIGAFIEAPLNPKISIQPEFLWKQAGTNLEAIVGDDEASLKLNTFDIPVLLKANIGESSTRPFVVVGPVFGFKAGDATFEVNGVEDPEGDDDISSTDVQIAFGAGVNVGRISLEGRYNLGVKDLDDSDSSAKSRNFQILVGFGF